MSQEKEVASVALVPANDANSLSAKKEGDSARSAKQTRQAVFTPANLTEAIALAKMIANSGIVPKEFKGKAADVLVAMQLGSEIGLAPMQALQGIAIINGRPTVWGDSALAVVQAHPAYEYHKEWVEGDGDKRCGICQVKRRGADAHTSRFSVLDAKVAGLWGKMGPWKQYPDRMLALRARGFALRNQFADALRGMSIAEEVMDIPVDNMANRQRETATLDIGPTILSISNEPNRGHGNEGFQKTQPDSENQEQRKQDPVMCGECRKIDGHEESCPHFKPNVPSQEGLVNARLTIAKKVIVAKKRAEKGGGEYLQIPVMAEDQSEFILYCFDTKFFEHFKGLSSGIFRCEYDTGKFPSLKHVLSLNGKQFVNDEPSNAVGEVPTSADLGFDEPQE